MSNWPHAFISEDELQEGMGILPYDIGHGSALAKAFAAHEIPHTRSGAILIRAEISVPHEVWYDPSQQGWHVRPTPSNQEEQP